MAFLIVFMLLINICFVRTDNLNDSFSDINSPTYFANRLLENLKFFNFNVTEQCGNQTLHYGRSLLIKPKAQWALRMFDAGSKLPSGFYSGNLVDLGFFDQCVDVHNDSAVGIIDGKYCIGAMPLFGLFNQNVKQTETRGITPGGGLYFAICLPSACSANEIEEIYRTLEIPLKFEESLCQTKTDRPELDNGDIAMISFLSIVCFLMVTSTTYDVVMMYLEKEPHSQLLLSFSIFTNGKKLIATSSGKSDQISCIHGIRAVTMMWIILGHKYLMQIRLPIRNNFDLFDVVLEPANMFVRNAYVSVDTFFLLGGIVIVYTFMGAVKKGTKFNLIVYYIHRYLRLTPLVAVTIAFILTLMKHCGSGPVWPDAVNTNIIEGCKSNWWRNLLYIQNLGSIDICISQSWYLGVDFQLFLISPLLLLPLGKWARKTLALTVLLIVLSTLAAFLLAWFLELRNFSEEAAEDYMKYYYNVPWIRCTSWLIGIIVGYLIFQVKQENNEIIINKVLVLLLWGTSLALLYVCLFQGHDMINEELLTGKYDKLKYSFYLALARPTWAIALSWIIFACAFGYGGPVNWLLSLPVFQVLSKLTYSLYIIHNVVIIITIAQMRSPALFTHTEIMHAFWGDYMIMVTISFVLTLAFESPIITLEKFLFQTTSQKKN